jgi:hypothetical protein
MRVSSTFSSFFKSGGQDILTTPEVARISHGSGVTRIASQLKVAKKVRE